MKAQAALIGPDGSVKLNPVAAVYFQPAIIGFQGNLEHDSPLRFNQPFQNGFFFIFGMS